jgi:predicted SAM-dependent methyltransferase
MVDFQHTKISLSRSVWSYAKVQSLVTTVVRDRKLFFKPLPRSGKTYLDVGCGPNISPGFYNIDYDWRPGIDRVVDIRKGLHLPDDSVDGIFSEHCLEHVTFEDASNVLRELHRIMRPGAALRVIVPDGEIHARAYVRSLDEARDVTPYAGHISKNGISTPIMCLNACMRDHGHLFIYDFATMSQQLAAAGFREITKCEHRQGRDPMLLKDADSRAVESLRVEAVK